MRVERIVQLSRRRRRDQGFSLIELLIAVAIIMIIMAIAIPNLEKLKQNTGATAAASNLRTLSTTLNVYASSYSSVGYPPTLLSMGPPENGSPDSSSAAHLIDETMAKATTTPKQGYLYTYTPASGTPCSAYVITAAPQAGAGTRYFFMDQSGAIRYSDGAPATASSPILQ